MYAFIIVIHTIACLGLMAMILIQQRKGGLVEGFSDFESMFGPKTNTFINRLTTILATLFLFTCLLLAFFSARESRSLMERSKGIPTRPDTSQAQQMPPLEEVPKPEQK
jgi:protein translocase SecG subunit